MMIEKFRNMRRKRQPPTLPPRKKSPPPVPKLLKTTVEKYSSPPPLPPRSEYDLSSDASVEEHEVDTDDSFISTDNEKFTYNDEINGIQEHIDDGFIDSDNEKNVYHEGNDKSQEAFKNLPGVVGGQKNTENSSHDSKWYLSHAIYLCLTQQSTLELSADTLENCCNAAIPHKPFYDGGLPFQSFDVKEFAPIVFRDIRRRFGTSDREYILNYRDTVTSTGVGIPKPLVGGHKGAGKSGVKFYYTNSLQFIVKEVKLRELEILRKMIKSYYYHLFPNVFSENSSDSETTPTCKTTSLLPKIVGLYSVKYPSKRPTAYVIMHNVFYTQKNEFGIDIPIHHKFDLKGSTRDRHTDHSSLDKNEETTKSQEKGSNHLCNESNHCNGIHPSDDIKSISPTAADDDDSNRQCNRNQHQRKGQNNIPMISEEVSQNSTQSSNKVLKDLNFCAQISLGSVATHSALLQQLAADATFLRNHNIMDYSLLIGIHKVKKKTTPKNNETSQSDGLISIDEINSMGSTDTPTIHSSAVLGAKLYNSINGGTMLAEKNEVKSKIDDIHAFPISNRNLLRQERWKINQKKAGWSNSISFPSILQYNLSIKVPRILSSCTESKLQIQQSMTSPTSSKAGTVITDAVRYNYQTRSVHLRLLPEGSHCQCFVSGREIIPRDGDFSPQHTLYILDVDCVGNTWRIYRRYSDFVQLLKDLDAELNQTGYAFSSDCNGLPRLPQKTLWGRNFEKCFLDRRQKLLNFWIKELLTVFQNNAANSPSLRCFLTNGANRKPASLIIGQLKNNASKQQQPLEQNIDEAATNIVTKIATGKGIKATLCPWGKVDGEQVKEEVILFMGIIDILQDYSVFKVAENSLKSKFYHGHSISAVKPPVYCVRFINYMSSIFLSGTPKCDEISSKQTAKDASLEKYVNNSSIQKDL